MASGCLTRILYEQVIARTGSSQGRPAARAVNAIRSQFGFMHSPNLQNQVLGQVLPQAPQLFVLLLR